MNRTDHQVLMEPAPDLSAMEKPHASAFPESVDILGIRFHAVNPASALNLLETFITQRVPRQISLGNAHSVALAWKDAEYRTVLDRSDLVLADGMSIVWGGKWIGVSLPGRVAGPDLTEALCARAVHKGYRIFLLGSSPDNLQRLKDVLLLRWPDLVIVGTHSPSMCDRLSDEETADILQEVHRASPDILLVGMSAPKQELWIAKNLQALGVPVCIGIGAAFDFLSGKVPRAPQWMQTSGLEWLYRLGCEPRRLWKRYLLGNAIFLSHLAKAFLRLHLRRLTRRAEPPRSVPR